YPPLLTEAPEAEDSGSDSRVHKPRHVLGEESLPPISPFRDGRSLGFLRRVWSGETAANESGGASAAQREVSNVATMTAPASLLPNTRASISKGFRRGTHRAVPPAETVERVRPFLSAMGITRVANITGLDKI